MKEFNFKIKTRLILPTAQSAYFPNFIGNYIINSIFFKYLNWNKNSTRADLESVKNLSLICGLSLLYFELILQNTPLHENIIFSCGNNWWINETLVKFDEKSPLKIFGKKLPSIHETTKMDSERHQSKYVLIGCNYFIKTLKHSDEYYKLFNTNFIGNHFLRAIWMKDLAF